MKRYRIHGLSLHSEIDLAATELDESSPTDLSVKYGPRREIPWHPSGGKLLALYEAENSGFALTEAPHGYTIRFYGWCDFELSGDFSELTAILAPDTDEAIASILLSSNVLSCVLGLKNECVLHASALQIGPRAIGLIGPSGSGKSTLAAVLCAAGLPLITDDALRCSLDREPYCHAGARELRLRAEAKPLVDLFSAGHAATSLDGRHVVHPKPTSLAHMPLVALIQPEFRQEPEIGLRRLHGSQAMLTLIAAGRITWWQAAEMRKPQFKMLTELCKWVPTYALSLPRSAAFTPEGRHEIQRSVESVVSEAGV